MTGPGCTRPRTTTGRPKCVLSRYRSKAPTSDMLHVIDDDLAVQYLPAKKIKRHRLALACKPHDVFFFCIVPSQNLDNTWNADALTACHKAQTHWVQAVSRRSEGAEGYKIEFALDQEAFPDTEMALTLARRIAGSHLQGSQYRSRPASRPVAPDRGQAGPDVSGARYPGGDIFPPHRRLRFRVRDRARRLAERSVSSRLHARRETCDMSRPSGAGAANSASKPPFPIDDDTLVVRLFAVGRDDVLSRPWLAVSRHVYDLHTAYLSVSNILLPYEPDEQAHQASQGTVLCLRRLRHRRLGNDRQAGDGQGYRRGPMA